jgi:hypothetical protein
VVPHPDVLAALVEDKILCQGQGDRQGDRQAVEPATKPE